MDTLTADRDRLRDDFIRACGWGDAAIEPQPVDASFRHYFRLRGPGGTSMVMDAPAAKGEDVRPFIRIDEHLRRLGLSVPEIYHADVEHGFLHIEDFGDDTFLKLLDAGHAPAPLYELAVDSVIALQTAPEVLNVATTSYMNRFIAQAEWLLQWYIPDIRGAPAGEECERTFYAAWHAVLEGLPPMAPTLMLRDYHVGNLMLLKDRPGAKACGLLDFQDAEFAPRPYDLVCLLEDARRDIPPTLHAALLARYARHFPVDEAFQAWYAAIAAQRHMRVIGNFARLALRDNKPVYRTYIPRVFGYLERSLGSEYLVPMREWSKEWLPERG